MLIVLYLSSVASQVERCKSLANIWEEFNGSQSKSLSVESIDDAIGRLQFLLISRKSIQLFFKGFLPAAAGHEDKELVVLVVV